MGSHYTGLTLAGATGPTGPQGPAGASGNTGLFNVKDYGAVGNGSTNDIAAMRAAVAAANAAGGGDVYFPAGTYNYITAGTYESVLSPQANVRLVGAAGATIKSDLTCPIGHIAVDVGYAAVSVENLVFDVGGSDANSIQTSSTRTDVRNCRFTRIGNAAIYLVGAASKILVSGCYFTGIGYGVLPQDTSTATDAGVIGNMFVGGSDSDGVEINTPNGLAEHWNIIGNTFTGYTGTVTSGFQVGVAHARHINIIGNLFHDSTEAAVHIEDGSTFVNVKNNTFRTIGKEAIVLISGARDPSFIAICDNQISDCGHTSGDGISGIGSGTLANVLVDGNQLYDNGAAGLASSGIACQWKASRWTVTNNQIFNQRNAGSPGIWLSGQAVGYNRVANNKVESCGYGVYLDGSGVNTTVVENNDVYANTTPFQNDTTGGSTIIVRRNQGWATEARGATSVADGGTITHGLAITPTVVNVTPTTSGEMVSVTAKSSTTFTCAIKKHDNTAGTTQTVYWEAS